MDKYIIWGIVGIVLVAPAFAWNTYKMHKRVQATKEFASKPFACPNCGHKFYTNAKIIHSVGEDKAYLKCPSCGKRDVCGRPFDFDAE